MRPRRTHRAREHPHRPRYGPAPRPSRPAERDPAGMREDGQSPTSFRRRAGTVNVNTQSRICRRRGGDVDRDVPDIGDVRDRRDERQRVHNITIRHEESVTTSRARDGAQRHVRDPGRREAGRIVVFDQTVAAAFDDPAAKAAVAEAEAAVAAAGGPGTDIADPTQTANDRRWPARPARACSPSPAGLPTFEGSFGPATILIGNDTDCTEAVADAAERTRPNADGRTEPALFVPAGTTTSTPTYMPNIASTRR